MSFTFLNELPSPAEIKQNYPLSDKLKALKKERDAAISAVITGADSRFLVIIGPCSADNEDSVCDYVSRLTSIQEDVADKLILIPRVYTNKPRTTGEGYKGIASQPDPEKAPDMIEGLIAMRKMHIRAIEESGLTCADEMLYPENHRYLSDLLSYAAIGARSVENQQHRLTASGVGIPAGMKNPTGGDISVMMNSIIAAQHGQHSCTVAGRSRRPAIRMHMPFCADMWTSLAEIFRIIIMRICRICWSIMKRRRKPDTSWHIRRSS